MTVAPNCDSDSELPVHQKPDPPTQLSLLSQSMMDQEVILRPLSTYTEQHNHYIYVYIIILLACVDFHWQKQCFVV